MDGSTVHKCTLDSTSRQCDVPSRFRDELPAALEAAVELFSSRMKVAALKSLITDGPANRSELARRLGVPRSSLQDHLASLESLGIVRTDPGVTEPGPITRAYVVNGRRLAALLESVETELK